VDWRYLAREKLDQGDGDRKRDRSSRIWRVTSLWPNTGRKGRREKVVMLTGGAEEIVIYSAKVS
jgi:hypothetical protein